MKRHWVEYGEEWVPGPMSYWVHIETDDQPWNKAADFDPPKPAPVGGRGYARFYVEAEGVTLYFASLQELRACIGTLARRILPSTLRETVARNAPPDGPSPGPNQHWLSRLPARLLPWRRRVRLVEYLQKSLADFESDTMGNGQRQ
ncbi:MAG: hypothetical protein JWN24_4193 [Phycisphaerales bacterium]|nr:hypothetical protein [Phycisphaerales bacterium]